MMQSWHVYWLPVKPVTFLCLNNKTGLFPSHFNELNSSTQPRMSTLMCQLQWCIKWLPWQQNHSWRNLFDRHFPLALLQVQSKSGARARACLWGNGWSPSAYWSKLVRPWANAGKLNWGRVCPVHSVWAPGCPEVVRQTEWNQPHSNLRNDFLMASHFIINKCMWLRSETVSTTSDLKRYKMAKSCMSSLPRPEESV